MKKSATYICLLGFLCCLTMILVDGVLQPGYTAKSAVKVFLFLLLPLLFSLWQKLKLTDAFRPDRKALLFSLLLGIATFAIVMAAYALLHPYIDLSSVPAALEQSAGVTKDNFLFVGTYIALCNSLLEEFFFRCFLFLGLMKNAPKPFAYLFSAAAFAVYHAGMLAGMIGPALFLLALVALFLCGLLFNYFNARHNTIFVSWLIHMGANFAINTVGMHLLGML